jgi:putative ABC transport system ATP-binding protein
MNLLTTLNQTQGITIIMITHEPDIASYAERIINFRDGLIVSETINRRQ